MKKWNLSWKELTVTVWNWIAYLLFLTIWFLAFLFYRHYVCLAAFFAFLVLCPCSIASVFYLAKHLEVDCMIQWKQIEKEQPFDIEITIKNSTFAVPGNVTTVLELEHGFIGKKRYIELSLPVQAHGDSVFFMECQSSVCGRVAVCLSFLNLRDLLGLVSVKKEFLEEAFVYVMPKLQSSEFEINPSGQAQDRQEDNTVSNKGEDVSEVIQIRKYAAGDRLQNIHWKLSAKREELLVKEYASPVGKELVLLLDLRAVQGKERLWERSGRQQAAIKAEEWMAPLEDVLELYFSVIASLCRENKEMLACYGNGEWIREEHICRMEDLETLIFHVFDEKLPEQTLSAYDAYCHLYGSAAGILYFCRERQLSEQEFPECGGSGKQAAQKGDAVAVWL